MNAAYSLSLQPEDKTPLPQLFAYLHDLFHTASPSLRFDAQADPWWSVAQWIKFHEHAADSTFQLQLKDPQQALLRIQRTEIDTLSIPELLEDWIVILESKDGPPTLRHRPQRVEEFDADPLRLRAFEAFHKQVAGKPLSAITDVNIPEILSDCIQFDMVEDQVQVHKKAVIERFEDVELRQDMYTTFERVFRNHHNETWAIQHTNHVYDQLHARHYELKARPQKRLFLSFGLVSGQIGGKDYHNYLFHIPLKLRLEQQALYIEPDTLAHPIQCEQAFTDLLPDHYKGEPISSIEQRQQEVLRIVDQFNRQPPHFSLDPTYITAQFYAVAREMLHVFADVKDSFFDGQSLNFAEGPTTSSQTEISFHFAPVIQSRGVDSQIHLARDAARIVQKINELSGTGESGQIPDFFKKLFSLENHSLPLRIAYRNASVHKSPEKPKAVIPQRFLFPLPYNAEQLAIAQRLYEQDAVTVKGPPGTGKSHTIANLTSHYVAQGKSILIVSKNAKALEVIRGKLPGAIQHLAVSLVEEGQPMDQLKHSIDAIKDYLSRSYDWETVCQMERNLAILDEQYEAHLEQLTQMLATNQEVLTLHSPHTGKEESQSAVAWAQFVASNPHTFTFILDAYDSELPMEELKAALSQYLQITATLDKAYVELSLEQFPIAPSELPDSLPFEANIRRRQSLIEHFSPTYYESLPLETRQFEPKRILAELQILLPHFLTHSALLQQPRFKVDQLDEWLDNYENEISQCLNPMLEHQIELGALNHTTPEELQELSQRLRNKFNGKSQLGFLQLKTLSPSLKALMEIRIDERELHQLAQLDILDEYLAHASRRKRMHIILQQSLYAQADLPLAELENYLESLLELKAALHSLALLNQTLSDLALPTFDFTQTDWEPNLTFISHLPTFREYKELQATIQADKDAFRLQLTPESHPMLVELFQAWRSEDLDTYEDLSTQYRLLVHQAQLAEERRTLFNSLSEHLPQTARSLSNHIPEKISLVEEWLANCQHDIACDFFQLELDHFLASIIQQVAGGQALFEQLHALQVQRATKVEELVSYRTWYHKAKNLTDEQGSALSAWRNDIINIGKGQGKNTHRNMESAIENMKRAKDVVPVWVMTQEMAINFFPDPSPGQFDLLIIDEASQCDISMLNLIFRANKCMIVGDENQTSVSTNSNLFPIERTNQLLDRYLYSHPFKQQFNINNRTASIYTLSGVIYPNIITLMEHFRCRPEIIGWCNEEVYNRQIIPLKTATDDRFGLPVESRYVETQSEKKARPELVDQVVDLITGVINDFEAGHLPAIPTVGVLCLDSSNEAHQDLLIQQLAKNQQIRRYEEQLELVVGTSRKFQGDEREVMILTSTARHKTTATGKIRPPRAVTGEEMMRIYNVAASRAKEKSILLHCIHPDAIPMMNPNCYRKKLIEYYQDPYFHMTKTSSDPKELLKKVPLQDGGFRREVGQFLCDQGHTEMLHPQWKTGPYQVDFACDWQWP